MAGVIIGWLLFGAMLFGAWLLYQRWSKPGFIETRDQARATSAGTAATDPTVNPGVPPPGTPDRRDARTVIRDWAVAVGCLPLGETLNGRWDLDIGDLQAGTDTGRIGDSGGVWYPAYERLRTRIEGKMLDEVGSGWPANPPDPSDDSERSQRMDFRSCMWVQINKHLRKPTNLGFGNWRWATRGGGSGNTRKNALRSPLSGAAAVSPGFLSTAGGLT
jgi:hypothetical protein